MVLRADRFADVSAHPRFARLVERGLYLLGAMGDGTCGRPSSHPHYRPASCSSPGWSTCWCAMPTANRARSRCSHALRQTWRRREGRTLTVAGYRDAGGIREAVANTAEELYEDVPPGQRPLLRDLLLRLVAPTADGEPSRSRVPRRLVATEPRRSR